MAEQMKSGGSRKKSGSGPGADAPADLDAARRAKDKPAGDEEAKAAAAAAAANGNGSHKSLEELAAEAGQDGSQQQGEEADGQMFVLEQGKQVTLGTLYNRGTPVTFEVQLTGKTLKGPGNLISFSSPDVMLVVPARAGKVEVDPTYDDEGKVARVSIRQRVKTTAFYDSRTEAARVALDGE